jgi:hypothetical protein
MEHTTHVVQPGEHLSSIMVQYGFRHYETLWNNPANATLRGERTTPDILFPGDAVAIPDKAPKHVVMATEQRHRFILRPSPLELRLRVRDLASRPVHHVQCTLEVDGKADERTTDGQGGVQRAIPPTAKQARLVIGQETYTVDIGYLDPINTASGWQARLINLGYLEPPMRGTSDEEGDAGRAGPHPSPPARRVFAAPSTSTTSVPFNAIESGLFTVACWRMDDVCFDFDSSLERMRRPVCRGCARSCTLGATSSISKRR